MHMLHKYLRVEVSKLVLEEQFPEINTKYNQTFLKQPLIDRQNKGLGLMQMVA